MIYRIFSVPGIGCLLSCIREMTYCDTIIDVNMSKEDFVEIDLGYSPIPDSCRRRLDEVTVKKNGHIWRIHKNDPDPFPSKPHAINIENGHKMDLSTGDLYFGKQYQKTVQRKDLLAVRNLFENKGVLLLPLKEV